MSFFSSKEKEYLEEEEDNLNRILYFEDLVNWGADFYKRINHPITDPDIVFYQKVIWSLCLKLFPEKIKFTVFIDDDPKCITFNCGARRGLEKNWPGPLRSDIFNCPNTVKANDKYKFYKDCLRGLHTEDELRKRFIYEFNESYSHDQNCWNYWFNSSERFKEEVLKLMKTNEIIIDDRT